MRCRHAVGMVEVRGRQTLRAERVVGTRRVFRRGMNPLEIMREFVAYRLLLREDKQEGEEEANEDGAATEHAGSVPQINAGTNRCSRAGFACPFRGPSTCL